jgi:hypothetical protein
MGQGPTGLRPFALLFSYGARSQLALPFAEWGSVGLALPLPLLGGIKAHTLREEITHLEYKEVIHLEYKEITHFGYVLRPASVL